MLTLSIEKDKNKNKGKRNPKPFIFYQLADRLSLASHCSASSRMADTAEEMLQLWATRTRITRPSDTALADTDTAHVPCYVPV